MKILIITASLLLALISTNVVAQEKIVAMDPEVAILNSNVAKKRLADLQNNEQFKTLVTRFDSLRTELEALQKKESVNGLTWSDEQKQAHRSAAQGKVEEFNLVRKQLEGERQRVLTSVQRELTPVLEKVVTELVKEKGFELILNTRAIIYSTEQNTITQMVIDALNKETENNAAQ